MRSRLSSLFKRKKKKKKDKTIFGERIEDEEKDSRIPFRQRFSIFSNRKRINIPFLMKFKRIIAGLLFIIYAFVSLMSLTEMYSIMFICTAFILLEYLKETKRIKWVKSVDET